MLKFKSSGDLIPGENVSLLSDRKYTNYGAKHEEKKATPSGSSQKNVTINLQPPSGEKSNVSPLEDDVFCSKVHLSSSDNLSEVLDFKNYFQYFKIVALVFVWIACCFVMMTKSVKVKDVHQLSITKGSVRGYFVREKPKDDNILITIEGALLPPYYGNLSDYWMHIWVQMLVATEKPNNFSTINTKNILAIKNITEVRKIPLVSEKLIGVVPELTHKEFFELEDVSCEFSQHCYLKINMITNLKSNFPISLSYDLQPIDTDEGIIYAACILIFLYILIIFEIVHKTLAAIIASTMSLAVLAALNARPTTAEIISWIDIETLLLLFSMMALVAIFGETGIFDYLAVLAFKITQGRVWPLVTTLCFFTAIVSSFLDNVTTALLMTPVTIRLCEVMKLNPVPVLTCMILYSNIGGALTPIGDPPNVIIASNSAVIASGVNFSIFTMHMGIGTVLCVLIVYVQLRLMYNVSDFKFDEPADVQELKRQIEVYKRTAASMGSYSKEESTVKKSLMKRTSSLLGKLNSKTSQISNSDEDFTVSVKDLQRQYPIRDKILLIKCSIVLCFVIIVFFLHSLPEMRNLGLAWTAFLGALLLLILSGRDDIDTIVAKVEWGTLLFFAALFILMEAVAKLGLIDWIGRQAQYAITSVEQESRLAMAILIILWVSGCVSAFVDNIPLTTMMIRIATTLADNRELGLPLQPLIWALSFGACLGGNGTLFGASSNIVCAGVAEQHGYKFSFMYFMKVGVPVMLTTMCIVTVYLLVAHVVWQWH